MKSNRKPNMYARLQAFGANPDGTVRKVTDLHKDSSIVDTEMIESLKKLIELNTPVQLALNAKRFDY